MRSGAFALIHGAGGSAWDWHLVVPELEGRGHVAVAVDLPSEDPAAGWSEYADTVIEAIGDRPGPLVVVGHSLGGFTAPLVCARSDAGLLVFLAGMVPAPGERFEDWWTNAGYEESGLDDLFYHDVPPELAAEAQTREREESSAALSRPWPLAALPDVPTRYLLCRDDRLFTADWARRHARARLGLEPDELPGGHYVTLSRPRELADRLHGYAAELGAPA
ncbi:MAG TPA: alpha/beta hydrolase [Gaiellaceae bacterium]|nr:alpha/beta hydrolase [Gaiellaceae bacterium]